MEFFGGLDPSKMYTRDIPDTGFDVDLKYRPPYGSSSAYNWTKQEKPEDVFLNRFREELMDSGYFKKAKKDTQNYDIYGDRRRTESPAGDTITDLGGGNTLSAPNSALTTQLQMQALQQQAAMGNQPGLGQTIVGAGGTALGTAIGGPLGGTIGGGIGNLVGGLLPF